MKRAKLKRGRDRYRPLTRVTKAKLGQKVWHKHTYRGWQGLWGVSWEPAVVEIIHKSGLVTIRTGYGYERTVPVHTLWAQ